MRPVALLALVGCAAQTGPDSRIACDTPASAHPAAQRLQDLVDEKVAAGLPGLTIGVRTADGITVAAGGFADLEDRVAMNACNVHPMASIGKTWTAAMVMLEADRGTLSVDDRVADHLSEDVLRRLPNIDRITLHHLLSHSSGLPDFNADIG
ncbi:MAG: beta-lactamase family protein, partial [Myxococcales bacterium]|nr:beta-lactamase family protein [Myxococcales bacterium]